MNKKLILKELNKLTKMVEAAAKKPKPKAKKEDSEALQRFKERQIKTDPIENKLVELKVELRELQGWDSGVGVFKEDWDKAKLQEVKGIFEEMGFKVDLDDSNFLFIHAID